MPWSSVSSRPAMTTPERHRLSHSTAGPAPGHAADTHGHRAADAAYAIPHIAASSQHGWHSRPSQVWAGHSCLAAFCHGVTHVCFVLQRFQYRDRVHKIHEPLHVPHTCSLPVWDGTAVVWLSFKVSSVICHEGDTPDAGHYRAVLRTLSGKEVITDDGAKSRAAVFQRPCSFIYNATVISSFCTWVVHRAEVTSP